LRPAPDCRPRRAHLHLSYSCTCRLDRHARDTRPLADIHHCDHLGVTGLRLHAIPILTMFGCYMLTRDVSSDYLSTCVALAVIQSTASLLVAKPSIRRSWPSWYLMTTCQPVPVLSRKGSITGFSSESGMYAICTWALATASPAFDYEMRHRIDRCENGFA